MVKIFEKTHENFQQNFFFQIVERFQRFFLPIFRNERGNFQQPDLQNVEDNEKTRSFETNDFFRIPNTAISF